MCIRDSVGATWRIWLNRPSAAVMRSLITCYSSNCLYTVLTVSVFTNSSFPSFRPCFNTVLLEWQKDFPACENPAKLSRAFVCCGGRTETGRWLTLFQWQCLWQLQGSLPMAWWAAVSCPVYLPLTTGSCLTVALQRNQNQPKRPRHKLGQAENAGNYLDQCLPVCLLEVGKNLNVWIM